MTREQLVEALVTDSIGDEGDSWRADLLTKVEDDNYEPTREEMSKLADFLSAEADRRRRHTHVGWFDQMVTLIRE